MNLPIGQLIQGASQARNAYVGGQQDRQKDDLANALLARKLEREQQEQSLRDALTRAQTEKLTAPEAIKPPTPQRIYDPKRGVIVDELAGKASPIEGLPPAVEEPTAQQHVVDPVTGKVTFFDPKKPPADLKVTPQPPRDRTAQTGAMTNANMLSLRGQFNADKGVQNASEVATALRKVRASAADPSPAGDLSLLVGYMKLLDPGSVVREQEFATAAKSGSLPQQIQAAATKVVNGQRLTPEQRMDFVKRSEAVARSYQDQFKQVSDRYSGDAKAAGLDPARIVYDPFGGVFEPSTKITPAERQALKAKGFTDAQINQKYGSP